MHMPEMDGLALARQIKDKYAGLPMVMLTSLSEAAFGASDHKLFTSVLSKPVRSAELESSIARALGESSAGRALSEHAVRARFVAADVAPRRLLVAEDNPINQEVIIEVLRELGYEADVVENGRLALEALLQTPYPLVLMDCQMPELDGYQAARAIRVREAGGRRLPIIAVTAHALVGERDRAIAAGMDDYITKPLNPTLLREAIERWWPKDSLGPGARRGSSIPASAIDASDGGARSDRAAQSERRARVLAPRARATGGHLKRGGRERSEALRLAAHKLKGSCLSVGVPRMATLCATIETEPATRRSFRTSWWRISKVRERLAEAAQLKTA